MMNDVLALAQLGADVETLGFFGDVSGNSDDSINCGSDDSVGC